MSIPYQTSTAGAAALGELQKILAKFGCSTFGTMTDVERGLTIVQFRWRERNVSLEASWKGYAHAWLKENRYNARSRCTRTQHEERALEQAKISVCSILRDWVKGQVCAVECGIMSFEAAFMPHMMLPNGQRVIDRVQSEILLSLPPSS
jgi:hypothetical protein